MSDAKTESRTGLAAIRLLLLTGFRRNEALGLKPGWIMPAGGIDFPDTKAGPQARPIGKSAMKLLKAQMGILGEDTEWIFPADRGEGHYVGVPKLLARLAKNAKIKGVTPHSLRHTFGSVAGELATPIGG